MTLQLTDLYYYSFLAMFSVIVFTNLLPSDWVIITRPFVIISSLLSIVLLNNLKGVFYVLILYIFILIYTLSPLVFSSVNPSYLANNTRYLIYFVLIFGLIRILESTPLERLLYSMSKVFVVKLIIVGMISLNMNLLGGLFSNYILNGMDLVVHELFGQYRILDLYLFLFPLVFLYVENKSRKVKILVHSLLFFNILSSITFGIIFSYLIVMSLRYKYFRSILIFVIFAIFFIYYDYFISLYDNFLLEKSVSIEVKLNQFLFVFDNISIWGQGLGQSISIEGRVDSMLENVFIYWFIVYGIIGMIFMVTFFILFPFYICFQYRKNISLQILFYVHLSVLLVSASNPFLESVIGIIPMMIIVSFFICNGALFKEKTSKLYF
ncbi:hypothetical protein MHO82_08265 [Vibrio sp. Of7-15]|uniref:hypothetical protein n=1 Tax=Vibrio sp. Of7-15 TaxID=2724879 RepID=UPI001EF34D60|nr:hypothetical protein [Vibrio sp. Of7-15]MCG7496854.1 hypothetical protein [Vibrio sp. Of7-15]